MIKSIMQSIKGQSPLEAQKISEINQVIALALVGIWGEDSPHLQHLIQISGFVGRSGLVLQLTQKYAGFMDRAPVEQALTAHFAAEYGDVNYEWHCDIQASRVQPQLKRLMGVKNILAIASGKGGVGKSTVTANLALALHKQGARVGILDADLFGPSMPLMLGNKQKPALVDGKFFEPVSAHGIQMISIGSLMADDETPMIWRGAIVTGTLRQLLFETQWDDLDYLLIDLPPGTGDTQLTLAQEIPVTGALVVTTPQDVALIDAKKAVKMFEKVNIDVLGFVENMSVFVCPECGHAAHIFGEGGGNWMAEHYDAPLLAQLPLVPRVRLDADGGTPIVLEAPTEAISQVFMQMANRVSRLVTLKRKDYSQVFPEIVMKV